MGILKVGLNVLYIIIWSLACGDKGCKFITYKVMGLGVKLTRSGGVIADVNCQLDRI